MSATDRKRYIAAALEILKSLGFPKAQQNERSALCLLALLNLTPGKPWAMAENPLRGVTPMMEWMGEYYGKHYQPNTRETIRRQSLHQFCQAGLAVENSDQPDRPTNSPKWCYQIEAEALKLLKTYDSAAWESSLKDYLAEHETLIERYAKERKKRMIPVEIAGEQTIELSPGSHSRLTKAVIERFAPCFAPGSSLIYVGDTGDKWAYFDQPQLAALGVNINSHGKMPDVVFNFTDRNWLLLVECVTSHGPVNGKRHDELSELFKNSTAGIVYVTAFPNRAMLAKHIGEIAWETEVWVADAPTHLIHFNGERFLGPYN